MRFRFSFLNLLLLLMFWLPALLILIARASDGFTTLNTAFAWESILALADPSSLDDYGIHLIAILTTSFLFFIAASVVYAFFDFWDKLGYWLRYVFILVFYILSGILIGFIANALQNHYSIHSSCPGGSPLLFISGFFILYVPGGFLVTLIAKIIQNFSKPIYE